MSKFRLRDKTRERCAIEPATAENLRRLKVISTELLHYLYEVAKIDFSIYLRVGDELVEFIRPREFSHELLGAVLNASAHIGADIEVMVLKRDYPAFDHLLAQVRSAKLQRLLEREPGLDRSTLEVYATLSSASQMIVRGGITTAVVNLAAQAASTLVTTQIESEAAAATISKMVGCDPTLYDHSASVAMIASIIAKGNRKPPFSIKELELIVQCGLYHDAGKACIANAILNKPGRFNEAEYEEMKKHSLYGEQELEQAIAKGAPIDPLAARVAGEHHERFTGKGYPRGRSGRAEEKADGIHLYTRIVTIADVYSALLMKRVYKDAMSPEESIDVMRSVAAADFDPDIFWPFAETITRACHAYEAATQQRSSSRILVVADNETLGDVLKRTQDS